jgi:hypothetical protein
MEEQLAVHKMFCPNSSCSAFINLDKMQNCLGKSNCGACGVDICTQCKVRSRPQKQPRFGNSSEDVCSAVVSFTCRVC